MIKNNKLLLIIKMFLGWRIIDFIIIILTPLLIPYLGFFPYKDVLLQSNLPDWIYKLASFDGAHYILIARQGYMQYEQAFFPLYPLLIRFLSLINNPLLTGLIISNSCFLIGLYYCYQYLKLLFPNNQQRHILVLVLLLLFPTSFFFGAVYTEGLFFMLVILVIYSLKKNNYGLVSIFAILASLTRLVGVFLIIPIGLHLFNQFINHQPSKKINWLKLFDLKSLLTLLSPVIGLALYCFYLFITTGDLLFFLSSQPAFGANRSSHVIFLPQVIYRYIKIFITATPDSRYFVSVIEFGFFWFVLVVLLLDLFKHLNINFHSIKSLKNFKIIIVNYDLLGLNLFSLANLLLPTLTGTLSSVPRYLLLSISMFIYLSQVNNKTIKTLILIGFFLLHILLLGLFSQGYFIA